MRYADAHGHDGVNGRILSRNGSQFLAHQRTATWL